MSDFFSHVSEAAPDPILGLTVAFLADPREKKVNLSVGIYKTADQKTPVLSSVKEAEKRILASEKTKNYLPIDGDSKYLELVGKLIFGEELYKKIVRRMCSIQSLGGTGALRTGGEFLKQEIEASVYLSEPSWPNHKGVFAQCGLKVHGYPYYDFHKKEVSFNAMYDSLSKLAPQSVIVFHASCHNPSGADLDRSQWEKLCNLCIEKELIPFFDAAYLGFDHSIEEDSYAIRLFAEKGVEFCLAVSFSKSFSLYSERVGAFFLLSSESSAKNILSKLKIHVRRNYSNPPSHGARVVSEILQTPSLKKEWEAELSQMRERIYEMRKAFASGLCSKARKKNYSYLVDKKGLFSFCDLTVEQVETLRREYGIYMTSDGRVNIAGLNSDNLDYVIDAILTVGG